MLMDSRLIGFLNRAAGHELGAVQQYLAQSRICKMWGLTEFSRQFAEDANEEMGHLGDLMDALLRLGVTPQASDVPSVRLGRSLEQMIEIDRELEYEAIRLYEEATEYCSRRRDTMHQALFERILKDELEHLNTLDTLSSKAKAA